MGLTPSLTLTLTPTLTLALTLTPTPLILTLSLTLIPTLTLTLTLPNEPPQPFTHPGTNTSPHPDTHPFVIVAVHVQAGFADHVCAELIEEAHARAVAIKLCECGLGEPLCDHGSLPM